MIDDGYVKQILLSCDVCLKNLLHAYGGWGYDFILTYGNEAASQFVRYFSAYWPSFETAGVLIPQQGDPLLLIGPESYTYAADRSMIDEICQLL